MQEWPFPKTDLFHWVPLLNQFDELLESLTKTYELSKLQEKDFLKEDKENLLALLKLTWFLWENCTNRNLYASYEVGFYFLFSILKKVLKVFF
jgi:E3 ubiquitin-protein ligase HUWE1